MTAPRAWQVVENMPGRGSRVLSYLELDFGSSADGSALDLRYVPFVVDDPLGIMATQGQYWSQFGAQAPLHRSVLVVRRGSEAAHFGERYPHFDTVTDQGSTLISADSAERTLIERSLDAGHLRIAGRRLVIDDDGQPPQGAQRRLLEVMLDRLYREARLIYFPGGKSDFRTNAPEPTSVDLVGPLASEAGILVEQVRARGALAGFNSGFFVFSEEEFKSDPHAYAFDPVGLVVVDGHVISPPVYRRSALLLSRQVYRHAYDEARHSLHALRPAIAEVSLDHYAVQLPGGVVMHGLLFRRSEVPVRFGLAPRAVHTSPLNPVSVGAGDFAFYNRRYLASSHGRTVTHTPAAPGRLEVVIVGQHVRAAKRGGSTFIPGNGFVASLPQTDASEQVFNAILSENASLVRQEVDLGPDIQSTVFGCQVSVRLLIDGAATDVVKRFTRDEEFVSIEPALNESGIPPIHLFERFVRATDRAFVGFGIRPDNRCYVLAIEGCEPRSAFAESDSVGGSLAELSRYLLQLGCTEAVALDSGGSAEIVFAGKSIVRPADRNDVPLVAVQRLGPGGWLVFP